MKEMSTTELTAELTSAELEIQKSIAASDMYRLLSMVFRLPTEEMSVGLLDGSLRNDVLDIFEELGLFDARIETIQTKLAALQGDLSDRHELFTAMRREYTRLFTHPRRPAVDIYETLFLFQPEAGNTPNPDLFISPTAMDAERCYRQAGLVRSGSVNEPGDHMATELEFMAYLYLCQAKGVQEADLEETEQRKVQIMEFSKTHLQKWAIAFFDRCSSASESDVYQTLGQLGSLFMHSMLEH